MSEERGPVPGLFSIAGLKGGGGGKIGREFPSSTLTHNSPPFDELTYRFFTNDRSFGMPRESSDREMIEMMHRCNSEIKDLRRQLAELQPKAEAYDYLTVVLRLVPDQRRRTMSEDLSWVLEKRIRELEEAKKAVPEEA